MFTELTEELLDLQVERKGAGWAYAGFSITFCTTTTCCKKFW